MRFLPILALFFCLFSIFSCKKDKLTPSDGKLSFSSDTLLFDTVFTSIGSTTKYFQIRNFNTHPITLRSVRLARGASSFYRLNLDGVPGKSFENVEIPAGDSLFLFVEVTVDPNNENNPFIYQDSVLFENDQIQQDVDLVCFAKNAYFHYPTEKITFPDGSSFSYGILDQNTLTWPNDKPHVIYGYLVVDSAQSLTIPANTHIYLHQNAGIWVYRFGKLDVQGAFQQPVIFQHDRLEPDYSDIPGQWDRIWINEGATCNLNYAIIKNGFIGVQASFSGFDGFTGADPNATRRLNIHNTVIQNCSAMGLFTRYFKINASNLEINACGKYAIALLYGGNYQFFHCSVNNKWTGETRSTPSVYINNYTSLQQIPLDSAWFENCILYGNNEEEIVLDSSSTGSSPYFTRFKNCLVKSTLSPNLNYFKTCKFNEDPLFKDPDKYDLQLQSGSPAINIGNPIPAYPLDIRSKSRDGQPDAGANEY